ncbi:MAG: hypothetical protein ACI9R3_000672 [Verrucomicrobiales bacterium]|jgi:hypothetical protein
MMRPVPPVHTLTLTLLLITLLAAGEAAAQFQLSEMMAVNTRGIVDDGEFALLTEPPSLANLIVTEVYYHPAAVTARELAAGVNDSHMAAGSRGTP